MVLVCILISILLMLSPISVCAYEIVTADPIEPALTFHGYEVLGYDSEGNAVLSNADYLEYFDKCLEERCRMIENGEDLPDEEDYKVPAVQSYSGYPIQTYNFLDALDEVKDKTRFIDLPGWLGTALDIIDLISSPVKWAIGEALNNPIHAGVEVTFSERISSIGKKRIHYTAADVYELITCNLNFDYQYKQFDISFTRSGFGSSSSFSFYSSEISSVSLTWSASGYLFLGDRGTSTSSDPGSGGNNFVAQISMVSYSVNSLPVTTTSSTTVLPDNNVNIVGNYYNSVAYAENTFATNSRTYNGNHQLISGNNKYWNPLIIYNSFPVNSDTVINQNNVNNYTNLGYSWNPTLNTIDFDPDIFAAYVNGELLPQLEALYKQFYQKFPDINAEIGSPDINYFNPFEGDEEDTEGETLPPATLPPGSGGGGGMTPEELDGVLNQESFYILDMETALPPVMIDTLPDVNLPAELSSGAVGISNFVIDLFDSLGILPLFVSLSVLAFVVFTLKGG